MDASACSTDRVSVQALLYIANQGDIKYPKPSYDPVFPATERREFDIGTFFGHSTTESRMLGCVDTIELRSSKKPDQWYDYHERPPISSFSNHQERGGAAILFHTLQYSNVGSSLMLRQHNGLEVSKLTKRGYSMALTKEQWKVEAQQLFEASLTRIQIAMKDVALGTPAKYPNTIRVSPPEWSICNQTFLF